MRCACLAAAVLAVGLAGLSAGAHSFPERSEPRVGAIVRTPPSQVRIWFDGELEPAFSRIQVTDAEGHAVHRGEARVDSRDRHLLAVDLGPLTPGRYTVRWSVLAVDGHRTEGDFTFTLR
jgi:methionine-rich copper-binding protein CopC